MEISGKRLIAELRERVLAGGEISEAEAYALADIVAEAEGREAVLEAAEAVTAHFAPRKFDTCSIVNARSGHCPEDCKWCAQSRHYSTGCKEYAIVDPEECRAAAKACHDYGIGRLSLVASGRRVTGAALRQMAGELRHARENAGINICASMGLLGREELQVLHDAGVRRYHCNLETAPSYFSTLCTTHTMDDKVATIRTAREMGMEVCSGGIIGMGETMRQRVELALKLREVEPVSIPINILCPIPGTPLEHAEALTAEDILATIAIFRLVHPRVQLRFAGGRDKLDRASQLRAMRIGINGAIVGDLLTTVGSTVAQDRELVAEAGYEF
ncbi:MAG: biotin synthase BioB [Muribaculaceae bacterium]|nr:biotin synthase BioB [Muribaculaceae bacterium]